MAPERRSVTVRAAWGKRKVDHGLQSRPVPVVVRGDPAVGGRTAFRPILTTPRLPDPEVNAHA